MTPTPPTHASPLIIFARVLGGALLFLSLVDSEVLAQSATWSATPITGDWNTAGNWLGATVPNSSTGTATFGVSSGTSIALSASTQVNGITFNSGASSFAITTPAQIWLTLSGAGVTNNSGITQNFATTVDGSGNYGGISFNNSATAGTATVFTNGGATTNSTVYGGVTQFNNSATAGSGTFINNGGTASGSGGNGEGATKFYGSATAGNGTFINNGATVSGATGGHTFFGSSTTTAGNGTFTNNAGTVSGAAGGQTYFYAGNADNGTYTNNGSAVSGATSGGTYFANTSTAGNSTLIADGGTNSGSGGSIYFGNSSTGGTARVEVFGNGSLDISDHSATGVTIGSIEGTGNVNLGGNGLTVGSNNLSTAFAGLLKDGGSAGGTGGSLNKSGTGSLTVSGANTYTGGTTISAGALLVSNASGSALGTGAVSVLSGAKLGGSGFVGGITTVASGGHLASGNPSGTLTFANGLTLQSGAILDFQLGTSSNRIDVTGGFLTGASGITLNLSNSGGFTPGVSYTLFNFVSGQTSSFDASDFTFGTLIGTSVASDYAFDLTGTSLKLTYNGNASAIPEPSTYAALLGLVVLGFAGYCKRVRQAL